MKVKPIKIFDHNSVFIKQGKKYFPAIYQGVENPEMLYLRRVDSKFKKFNKRQIIDITGIPEDDLLNIMKMENKKDG